MLYRSNRLFGLSTSLSGQKFHLDTGTDVILASVREPCDRGNDDNNGHGGNTVVYLMLVRRVLDDIRSDDILMLLPVAGRSGGKRKRTVVRVMYTTEICYESQPNPSFLFSRGPYDIKGIANDVGQDEGTLGKSVTSTAQVDSDGDTIGKIQQDNRRGNNGVESTGRSKEDQSEDDDQCQVEVQRMQGNLQLGMDLGEVGRERQTAVSGKGIAHATACGHDSCGSKQHAHKREAGGIVSIRHGKVVDSKAVLT